MLLLICDNTGTACYLIAAGPAEVEGSAGAVPGGAGRVPRLARVAELGREVR